MPRITGSNTTPATTVRDFPIRPLYGIAIRDDLVRFRSGIGSTAETLRAALKSGDPKKPGVAGDNRLDGKEYKAGAQALKDLDAAIKALKGVPDYAGPRTPGSSTGTGPARGFPILPMYGIAIRDDLRRFRTDVNANIAELTAAIAKGNAKKTAVAGDGRLDGKELVYAKKALTQLKAAAAALKALPPAWR